jgi:hypothetical protein
MCFLSPARFSAELLISAPASPYQKSSGEFEVRNNQGISTPSPITAIFWDAWSAGNAVTALLRAGFSDRDLYAVGVFAGQAPDLRNFLDDLGIPAPDAVYCNDCFQDGAILLIVGPRMSGDQRTALKLVLRHGGTLPPSCELLRTVV